jgi:uncharacterized protein YkwD
MRIAREHSANMANQRKMEHKLDDKTVANRARDVGYRFRKIAENIAYSDGHPLKRIMKGWMDSPGHRANVLDKDVREIGVGLAKNDQGETYYTQVFGKRLTSAR